MALLAIISFEQHVEPLSRSSYVIRSLACAIFLALHHPFSAGRRSKTGPFATEGGFHNRYCTALTPGFSRGKQAKLDVRSSVRHLASAMSGHACVLTHGGLQLKNMSINLLRARLTPPRRAPGVQKSESVGSLTAKLLGVCVHVHDCRLGK